MMPELGGQELFYDSSNDWGEGHRAGMNRCSQELRCARLFTPMCMLRVLRGTVRERATQVRIAAIISSLTVASLVVYGQQAAPRMISTDTPNGKKGDVIAFSGANLQRTSLSGVYLTDGEHDFRVVVAEQTSTTVKFRIPESVPPGRFAFMALTAGKDAKFIELPRFKITIDQRGNFQIDDTDRNIRAACSAVYKDTADKKIRDLTVKEEQQVRNCQALGLYPPQ
jgi:hypothetical protein